VAIDEAGDPGFKFARASSRFFVVACVIFDDDADAKAAVERIRLFRTERGWSQHHELKFHTMRRDLVKEFLRVMVEFKFRVRAVVVDKQRVQSHQLRTKPAAFYNFIVKEMLTRDESLSAAQVKLDGEAGRSHKRHMVSYFRREVNRGSRRIAEFGLADSSRDDLIQLADVVAGSIYRSRLSGKTDRAEFIAILRRRIEDIWEFE